MKHKNVMLQYDIFELIKVCEEIYLLHHPEMSKIKLTKSKILFEVMRYYILTEKKYSYMFKDNNGEK